MTPDKEIELCESVATLVADMKHAIGQQTTMAARLAEHTEADSSNFEKLNAKMDALIAKDNQALGAAKTKAFMWSTLTSGGLLAIWELGKAMMNK